MVAQSTLSNNTGKLSVIKTDTYRRDCPRNWFSVQPVLQGQGQGVGDVLQRYIWVY